MRKNEQVEVSEDQQKAAAESERLKLRALESGVLSKSQRLSTNTVQLSKALLKSDGKDIIKKGSVRKNRFLLVFAAQIAPVAAGRMGTLAQLDGKNPVMYVDFPEGRLKFFGTLVFPKNKYMVCKVGNKDILAEDVLESMIVFSEWWWVGHKADNPDERQLALPPALLAAKRHENYSFSACGAAATDDVNAKGKLPDKTEAAAIEASQQTQGGAVEGEEDGQEIQKTVVRPQRASSRHLGNTPKYREDDSSSEGEEEDESDNDDDDDDDDEDRGRKNDKQKRNKKQDDNNEEKKSKDIESDIVLKGGVAAGGSAADTNKETKGKKEGDKAKASLGADAGKKGTIKALFAAAAANKTKSSTEGASVPKAAHQTPAPAAKKATPGGTKGASKGGRSTIQGKATPAPATQKRKRKSEAVSPDVIELTSDPDTAIKAPISSSKRPRRNAGAEAAKRLKAQQEADDDDDDVILVSGGDTAAGHSDDDSDFEM